MKGEVSQLLVESGELKQDSAQLQEQLTGLNSDIEKLSGSLDRIGTSITSLESSLKKARAKSSLGLSSISLLTIIGMISYSLFGADSWL